MDSVRNRSGDVNEPSVIRGSEQALRLLVLPELGPVPLREIHRAELQAFVDRLLVGEYPPSTIRNTMLPVRAVFRRAVMRGDVAVNPTTGLELSGSPRAARTHRVAVAAVARGAGARPGSVGDDAVLRPCPDRTGSRRLRPKTRPPAALPRAGRPE